MEAWEHHVQSEEPGVALCGASTRIRWCFMDAQHAEASISGGTRMQPAPCCLAVLTDQEEK